jgi:hypothetical protein
LTEEKQNLNEKTAELIKYRDLVLATIDYYLDKQLMKIKTVDFDSDDYLKSFRIQTLAHFRNGELEILKQWFYDLAEMLITNIDLRFKQYLHEKTRCDFDIFKFIFQRIDRTTENEDCNLYLNS